MATNYYYDDNNAWFLSSDCKRKVVEVYFKNFKIISVLFDNYF
jgi:hypothetical protein